MAWDELMRRRGWLAAGLLALPAVAAEAPAPLPAPDAEFLEFLGESVAEDEEFVQYMESRAFESELRKAEEQQAAPKDGDDER
jgi:hypothetical protein